MMVELQREREAEERPYTHIAAIVAYVARGQAGHRDIS
jgi:hypothetical protein